MSTSDTPSEKGIDTHDAWGDDVTVIDAATIRELEDESGDGCRFAAIAKTHDTLGTSYSEIQFPATTVLYVDGSGRYGFERTFIGHRDEWTDIPRTVAVGADTDVPKLPAHRQRAAGPVLETYTRVLEGGDQ